MTLTLPLPPSANRYWRIWRGHPVTSDEARAYKLTAGRLALVRGLRMRAGLIRLRLRFYRAQRRGDLDNRIKVLLDALQGVAYADDAQVVKLEAELHEDSKNPRVEVELGPA